MASRAQGVTHTQTFTVTPADLELLSADDTDGDLGEREFTVEGLGDVDEVVIALAEAGNVTVEDNQVSFEEDDGSADFGTVASTITELSVGDQSFANPSTPETVNVADVDEFTFEITGVDTEIENVVVVVYADDNGLSVDEDGLPDDVDFGVGGESYFVDPDIEYAEGQATDEFNRLLGQEVEIEVQVFDEADPEANELEVAGIPIRVVMVEDQAGDTFADALAGTVVEDTVVETDANGVATYTVTDQGADDDIVYDVYFRWTGSGNLAGLSSVLDGGDEIRVNYFEEIGAPEVITGELSAELLGTGMDAEVTAEVVDAAGIPVPDVDVRFSTDRKGGSNFTVVRTTDASGVATYSYTSNSQLIDEWTVTAIDADGDPLEDATPDVIEDDGFDNSVGFFSPAGEGDVGLVQNALSQNVIGANADLEVVFLATTGTEVGDEAVQDRLAKVDAAELEDMFWVGYTGGDLYNINAANTTAQVSLLEDALFDAEGEFDVADPSVKWFEAAGRDDVNADTVYNALTAADEGNFLEAQLVNVVAAGTDVADWGADGDTLTLTFNRDADPSDGEVLTIDLDGDGTANVTLTLKDTTNGPSDVSFAVDGDDPTVVTLTAEGTTSQGNFTGDDVVIDSTDIQDVFDQEFGFVPGLGIDTP